MGAKWIDHNNKKVLVVEYTGLTIEREMVALLESIPSFLSQTVEKGRVLVLTDLTGCYVTPGFMEASKKMDKEISTVYQFKIAILGITGAKAILLKIFNIIAKNKIAPFNDKMDALNYLTKE